MDFAAPLWLTALLPWAALAWYVLTGRHTKTPVPFLNLWKGERSPPKPKPVLRKPPAFILIVLLSLLLCVIAAASPRVKQAGVETAPVTVIVDRGIATSAGLRFRALLQDVSSELGPVDRKVIAVPPSSGPVDQLDPTAIDTTQTIDAAVRTVLADAEGPVLVLTDHTLATRDERVLKIGPTAPARNVGIVDIAVRAGSPPQLMATIRNQSDLSTATLRSGVAAQTIELPARGQTKNYFLDLPTLDRIMAVEIEVQDDQPADNAAWLVRQRTWPSIEVRGTVPATLAKMIDVYTHARPSAEDSRRIVIADSLFAMPQDIPSAGTLVIPPARQPNNSPTLRLEDHPVVAGVNWPDVIKEAVASGAPGDKWRPVVSSGERVYVAVRDKPTRGVWVGFTSDAFPRSTDYVIFWTNVFDWLGQAGDQYIGGNVVELSDEWQPVAVAPGFSTSKKFGEPPAPGVYKRTDGALRAMNAMDVRFGEPEASDWRAAVKAMVGKYSQPHGIDLTAPVVIAALLTACFAFSIWPKKN